MFKETQRSRTKKKAKFWLGADYTYVRLMLNKPEGKESWKKKKRNLKITKKLQAEWSEVTTFTILPTLSR